MKILIVLTSHSQLGHTQLGNSEGKTGFWIEEFATPYYLFKKAGVQMVLASPNGGQPPIDPKSDAPENQTEATIKYKNDAELLKMMANTIKLETIKATDFDAVFYPGGHGPLWDLSTNEHSIALLEDFWAANKPIATVCHAPSVLLNVKNKEGNNLVKGKKVTGFSNTEEIAVKLDKIVPFLLEDELKMKGGIYSKKGDWESYVVVDGLLITGQNPASSGAVTKALLAILQK
ncbi:type 1 glutamine amidotransferase domain-containing protein [Flavobacterium sp.]|uniref:type 1 glutamine amidotransferase domain-containing protein n=1 Tax=Flavobacterium sp. TaxID=239 RepID=UPI0025DE262B|nr:type 1 glutamine amidotransferase domain-containing protein [Flavobacterium sp.]